MAAGLKETEDGRTVGGLLSRAGGGGGLLGAVKPEERSVDLCNLLADWATAGERLAYPMPALEPARRTDRGRERRPDWAIVLMTFL